MDPDPDDYHYQYLEQKPELPKKNYTLFCMHERESFTITHFWEGKGGELPFFLEVDVGYNPDDEDPFMYPYESGEMLFAFKKDSQKRALLHDSHQRTLSLPMSSDVKFIARKAGEQEVTLSELMKSETLPIQVEWANKDLIEFEVDRQTCNHTFFGNILFSGTYEENFFWCLAIDAHGKANAVPRVLPVNLKDVIFGHIVRVKGVGDSDAKLKEFKDMFVKATESIDHSKDPFFQELAIVDRSTIIFQGQQIEPHIDQNTFVRIRYKKRPVPPPPENAPSVPPRQPVPHSSPKDTVPTTAKSSRKPTSTKNAKKSETSNYSPIQVYVSDDHHQYDTIGMTASDVKGGKEREKLLQDGGGKGGLGSHECPESGSVPIYEPTPKAGTFPRQIKPNELAHSTPPLPPRVLTMNSAPTPPPALPPRPGVYKVEALTINDVADKLKDLGLKKYRKRFEKERIDGVLLKRLTLSSMQETFEMTQMEALRLATFISTGHIPK